MIAGWLVYAFAVAALVGGAAFVLDRAVRALRLPTRGIWSAALVASTVIPAYRLLVPSSGAAGATSGSDAEVVGPLTDTFAVVTTALTEWNVVIIVIWLVASVLLLGAVLYSNARLSRTVRALPTERLHGRPFHRSPEFGPALVGITKSRIVLPSWLRTLGDSADRTALLHEHAHREARDLVRQLFGLVFVVAQPWNIAMWWQFARLRAAIEYDCDARLLDTGRVALRDYATTLLEIAERRQRTPLVAVTLAPVRSHIGKRVIAMTEFGRHPRFGTAAVAASLSVVLFAAACETPEPLALEPEAAPTIEGQLVEFVGDSVKTIHLPLKFAFDVGNGVHEFEVSRVEIVELTELTATAVRLHVGLKSKLREREGT